MNVKNLFKTSNGDLQALRVLIALAAALAIIGAIFDVSGFGWSSERASDAGWLSGFGFETEPNGITVNIDPADYATPAENPLIDVTAIEATVPAEGTARLLDTIGSLLTGLGIGSGLAVVYLVLTSAVKGRFFERASAKLLGVAAATMIVAQVGEVVTSFARLEALRHLDLTPMTGVSFAYGILALVFGALSRAWTVGADMADETALTV